MADLRESLNGLVEEWDKWCSTFERKPSTYEEGMIRSYKVAASQLAAILAESEPGCEVCAERRRVADESAQFHKDVEEGERILAESEICPFIRYGEDEDRTMPCANCGQPRSAHEPKP